MNRTMLGSAFGALAAVAVLTVGGVASAATTHGSVHAANSTACPVVIGNDGGTPVLVPATLSSTGSWTPGTTTAATGGQLAFTGTDVGGVVVVGGGLLLGGTLLVRASRFRRPAQS